uniref:Uncharacterized protein n=1 Tax=Pyxicephalus adspersus TaxID=30357 RepID=A0AAV2ZUK3_PYXAD|nr:TPA: hypothetical protein GDO54_016191 [Pyxicephalus adspersus]
MGDCWWLNHPQGLYISQESLPLTIRICMSARRMPSEGFSGGRTYISCNYGNSLDEIYENHRCPRPPGYTHTRVIYIDQIDPSNMIYIF